MVLDIEGLPQAGWGLPFRKDGLDAAPEETIFFSPVSEGKMSSALNMG